MYLYLRMGFSLLVSLYTCRVVLQTLGVVDYGLYYKFLYEDKGKASFIQKTWETLT